MEKEILEMRGTISQKEKLLASMAKEMRAELAEIIAFAEKSLKKTVVLEEETN